MAESKKFYWLKLKRDFFKRHDIRIVESMPNGKDYILFYLKLLLESIDHEGTLRFSDTIPYNEQMLSVVTNTNIDIVRSAMKLFIELNMMQVFDDQTIYMTEVDKLIGSECSSANRVREHRKNKRLLQCNDDVTKSNTEIEKDKEIDIDKEIETEEEESGDTSDHIGKKMMCVGGSLGQNVIYLTQEQDDELIEKLGIEAYDRYMKRLSDYIINHRDVKNHYETILKWYKEDTKV